MTETTDLQTLREAIDDQRIAMLTTIAPDGHLQSKPMTVLEQDANGHLWCLVQAPVGAAGAISTPQRANLAFSKDTSSYVSVSCTAQVLHDRARVAQLWTPMAKPWFPDGPDAPDLACLRLVPERAELWSGPSNTFTMALAFAASVVAGKPVGLGEHQVLDHLAQPQQV